MSSILGIDLGTTNTVVAIADDRGVRAIPTESGSKLIPSVVSFHPNGKVLVGTAASDRRVIDARHTVYSVKRLIGRAFDSPEVARARERFAFSLVPTATNGIAVQARGQVFELPEISALVLREARRVAEHATGQTFSRAVVTVPANFNDLQRSATLAAGRIAGLEIVRILNEPTAAALAYGLTNQDRQRVVIYDFGGGTFDVTILELAGEVFEVIATAGDTFLGGDDIDRQLADVLSDLFLQQHRYDPRTDGQTFERIRTAAEWSKCELSYRAIVDVEVPEVAFGVGGSPIDLLARLDQPRFEQLVRPTVERTLRVCDEALRVAGLAPTQVDNVVLVGGSTRMPIVQRMVAEYFGREPLTHVDPDLVVALGAAVQARALEGIDDAQSSNAPFSQLDEPGAQMPTIESGSVRPSPRAPPRRAATLGGAGAPHGLTTLDAPDLATAPSSTAPLLVDVTPLSLSIETVGGFCETVIPRNAPIPCEQSRGFVTAQDGQTLVRLRICQGESRKFAENHALGELLLEGLRPAARGSVEIMVTFAVDADGSIGVEALDAATGISQRTRLERVGAIGHQRIDELRARHDAMQRDSEALT